MENYLIERLSYYLLCEKEKSKKEGKKFQITKKMFINFCYLNNFSYKLFKQKFQIKNAPKYNVHFFCLYVKNISK